MPRCRLRLGRRPKRKHRRVRRRWPDCSACRSGDVGAVHRGKPCLALHTTAPNHDRQHGAPRRRTATGDSDTIRRIVYEHRADQLSRLEVIVSEIIPRLPVFGWPGGLFGRRDAILLLLASSGLRFEQISALRRNNIRIDGEALIVGGVHPFRLTPAAYGGSISPVGLYRRWAAILDFLDRTPSTRLLAEHLDGYTLPAAKYRAERPELLPAGNSRVRCSPRSTAGATPRSPDLRYLRSRRPASSLPTSKIRHHRTVRTVGVPAAAIRLMSTIRMPSPRSSSTTRITRVVSKPAALRTPPSPMSPPHWTTSRTRLTRSSESSSPSSAPDPEQPLPDREVRRNVSDVLRTSAETQHTMIRHHWS